MISLSTDTLLSAFEKAYEAALANFEAASALADLNHFAASASLTVLSLEEVGKMMLIDGLLFARTGDERYKRYQKGHLSHRIKLDALELYPLFLNYLMTVDPRRNESPYKQAKVIVFTDLKAKRQRLVELFGEDFSFQDLDSLKQKGFYSHEDNGALRSNKEAIDSLISKALWDLAWRVIDSLKFVLGKSLEKYKEQFATLREKVDEPTLEKVRKEARRIVANIFGLDEERV